MSITREMTRERTELVYTNLSANSSNDEVELTSLFSSDSVSVSDTSDMNEITPEELISSFVDATFTASNISSAVFGTTGVIAGAIVAGPLGATILGGAGVLIGRCGDYVVNSIRVIGMTINDSYDVFLKKGLRAAHFSLPSYGQLLYSCMQPSATKKAENIKRNALIAKFVTPLEYKDTLDTALNMGAGIGTILGLGVPSAMSFGSAIFGECFSVIAGAVKGGYDGLVKGGFKGLMNGSSFNGFAYGAAVGYFHYHHQYNPNSKYPTPAYKIYEETSSSILTAAIEISNFLVDASYAALSQIGLSCIGLEGYQFLNLFSTENKSSSSIKNTIVNGESLSDRNTARM